MFTVVLYLSICKKEISEQFVHKTYQVAIFYHRNIYSVRSRAPQACSPPDTSAKSDQATMRNSGSVNDLTRISIDNKAHLTFRIVEYIVAPVRADEFTRPTLYKHQGGDRLNLELLR